MNINYPCVRMIKEQVLIGGNLEQIKKVLGLVVKNIFNTKKYLIEVSFIGNCSKPHWFESFHILKNEIEEHSNEKRKYWELIWLQLGLRSPDNA